MNDDELDAMLRSEPRPKRDEREPAPRRLPVAELIVFAIITAVVLAWASGVLSTVLGG